MNPYRKLAMMSTVSFIIMYGVMFLNVDEVGDIYLSLTRFYMSILMVSPMICVMILFMKHMYPNPKMNRNLIVTSTIVFLTTFYCLRTQAFVSDTQYMKAMIPHHSSAIMTSTNASITTREVRSLADSIRVSQRHEIQLMKNMLKE